MTAADAHDEPEAEPAWRSVLETRWEALRCEALALGSAERRKLRNLAAELERLVIVGAWYRAGGNVTHAAAHLRTSRKKVREHLAAWHQDHPELLPGAPMPSTAVGSH
jgi:DNA-binding NtrC family response regulator